MDQNTQNTVIIIFFKQSGLSGMEFHTFAATFYASYSALRIALEIFPGSNLKSTNIFPQIALILKSKNRILHNYSCQSTLNFPESVFVIQGARLSLYQLCSAFKRHILSESWTKLFNSCRNCARKLHQKALIVWFFTTSSSVMYFCRLGKY